MYVKDSVRKWMLTVLICLLIIAGCAGGLVWNYDAEEKNDSHSVINRVRLQVSGILLYMGQYHNEISNNRSLHDTLLAMTLENKVKLIYTKLNGQVLFNSTTDNSLPHINIETALHYDLYHAKVNKDTYRIAFPVVDEATKTQVGNAIFTIPVSAVFVETSRALPIFLFSIMMITLLLIGGLTILLCRKIRKDVIEPVHQLKDYSEAILKGDYEQPVSCKSMDEIGEVYAMFDQMRMEIMNHSLQRDAHLRAQKELISNISHEIKTPLTTLKAYLEAIREGVCTDMSSVMEYVEVMYKNTLKMTRLTEDLLLHALRELGQISVTLTEQYSKDVLSSILQPIGHYVRTTGVHYVEPQDIPNVLIHVDAHRLEQVISNLISNALKHTSTGDMISVNTALEEGYFKITIADTGRGILPGDMPFVFDRYFKGNMNAKAKKEGTGLGLSICKYIIEAHHGTISFKSVQGQGTVFYCMIPV